MLRRILLFALVLLACGPAFGTSLFPLPLGTATGQTYHWDATARTWVLDTNHLSNGSTVSIGSALDSGSMLAITAPSQTVNSLALNQGPLLLRNGGVFGANTYAPTAYGLYLQGLDIGGIYGILKLSAQSSRGTLFDMVPTVANSAIPFGFFGENQPSVNTPRMLFIGDGTRSENVIVSDVSNGNSSLTLASPLPLVFRSGNADWSTLADVLSLPPYGDTVDLYAGDTGRTALAIKLKSGQTAAAINVLNSGGTSIANVDASGGLHALNYYSADGTLGPSVTYGGTIFKNGLATSQASQTANTFLAAPNAVAGVNTNRAIVTADLSGAPSNAGSLGASRGDGTTITTTSGILSAVAQTPTLAGDVTGASNANTVVKIKNVTITTAPASTAQTLVNNGSGLVAVARSDLSSVKAVANTPITLTYSSGTGIPATLTISGAGTSAVNGTFTKSGTNDANGNPYYVGPTGYWMRIGGNSPFDWQITTNAPTNSGYSPNITGAVYYYQAQTATNPTLASALNPTTATATWNANTAASVALAPAPTVTGTSAGSTPTATVDGYALAVGDEVLCQNQATASQNGPQTYQGASASFTRPADWTTGSVQPTGAFVVCTGGTAFKGTTWYLANTSAATVDTTATTWAQGGLSTGVASGFASGILFSQTADSTVTAIGTSKLTFAFTGSPSNVIPANTFTQVGQTVKFQVYGIYTIATGGPTVIPEIDFNGSSAVTGPAAGGLLGNTGQYWDATIQGTIITVSGSTSTVRLSGVFHYMTNGAMVQMPLTTQNYPFTNTAAQTITLAATYSGANAGTSVTAQQFSGALNGL